MPDRAGQLNLTVSGIQTGAVTSADGTLIVSLGPSAPARPQPAAR